MTTTTSALEKFDQNPSSTPYDPGQIRIWYDNRTYSSFQDQLPTYQRAYLAALSRMGWTSLSGVQDLEPGKLRLIWYTVRLLIYIHHHVCLYYLHRSSLTSTLARPAPGTFPFTNPPP